MEEEALYLQKDLILIPLSTFTCYVSLGCLPNLSEPQNPHL